MIVHPAAELFPMLSGPQLKELRADMEIHGMREPIKRWNGMVIDGRNRMEARKGTMVKAIFQDMDFADESEVIAYIVSTNIQRRHLTTKDRATIAAKLANLERGSNQHTGKEDGPIGPSSKMTVEEAAKHMQVGIGTVKRAKAVLKKSPETFAKIESGELSVNAAHKQVAPPKLRPTPPPAIIPDPDLSHTDDPPPFIPPAKPKHFIGPAEGEDEDEWKDAQAEPEANWYEPTDEARAALAAVNALDEESRQWVIEQL